jgi:hypothetical protein
VGSEIREALEIMAVFMKRERERYIYQKRMEYLWVQQSLIGEAKAEGHAEGESRKALESARKLKLF